MTTVGELAAFLGPRLAERAAGEVDEMRSLGMRGTSPAQDELMKVRLTEIVANENLMPESSCHQTLFQIAENHGFAGHPAFKASWRLGRTG